PEFLENLNALHDRLRMAVPHLNPPEFRVRSTGDQALNLQYFSDRPGLTPMVLGLLEGLGERFKTPTEAKLVSPKSDTQDYDEFEVVWTSAT
ncbi:MAG: heme NO-binding domain-containing protein, partial [Verrucomicrobiota bacterium]